MNVFKSLFADFIPEPFEVDFAGKDNDEHIVLLLRRHIVTNLGWIFSSFLMLILPPVLFGLLAFVSLDISKFLPGSYLFVAFSFWYLMVITFMFEAYLNWYSNVYMVTSKRLVDVDFYGILHVHVSEAPIENIEDASYEVRGLVPTLLNYGNVKIQTASEDTGIEFDSVPSPAKVHDYISDLAAGIKKNGKK